MRIGIFLEYIQERSLGGGYTFTYAFLEKLKQLAFKHTFFIFYYENGERFSDTDTVKFIPIKKLSSHIKIVFFKIRRKQKMLDEYFSDFRIDLLYTISPVFFKSDNPSFVTIWDFGHKDIPYFPEVFVKGQFDAREKIYSGIITRASRVIVSNEIAKQKLLQYYSIQEDKVIVNALPTPDYIFSTAADESVLSEYGLEKNSFVFYPAQFWAHKNHIRIVKAIKVLKEKGIDIKVVFSGSDKGNMQYVKEQAEKLGVSERILFLGFVSVEQFIALYKNALALVYASFLGPDNLPPLEAMALKCPVLVSGIDGHKEQLKDSCLFFDPLDELDLANQLENLLKNGYPQDLIEKGYDLALANSTERYLNVMLEQFDKFGKILECYRQ